MGLKLWAVLASGLLFFSVAAYSETKPPWWVGPEELGEQMCQRLEGRHFIGCRPSPGECRYSCLQRDGQALEDKTGWICDRDDLQEGLVCCCP